MSKRWFYRALCVCVAGLLAAGASADDWVRIGSWNIEHLGNRSFGQHEKALAEHIRLAGPDILALQEIYDNDENDDTRTNTRLDQVFNILNGDPGQDWDYVLFANKQTNDKSQLCGLAWNKKRVSKVGNGLRINVVDDNDEFFLWDRHPHAVKFSLGASKTDIVVIALHMKANTSDFAAEQREVEAEKLVGQLDAVKAHFDDNENDDDVEQDIVLIGDTNCKKAGERSLLIFEDAGFKDLNAADRTTFVSGDAPFDRALVPEEQTEFRFSRQYVLISCDAEEHEKYLSDHHMILVPVRIEPDDD
jgi:endonuclease/exonuclease/phosphatase family metal-dependent hydrolase